MDLLPAALAFAWSPDRDGQGFHMSANDPGGATSYGVTFRTWQAWQSMHGLVATLVDFKTRGRADFEPLYRAQYWNAIRAGEMGAIGVQMFDVAMLSGPVNAVKFLQHVLGSVVDGYIGPQTVAALAKANPAAVNFALCNERKRFYAALPTAKYFERGWDRRAEACRDLVASMLKPAPGGIPVYTIGD